MGVGYEGDTLVGWCDRCGEDLEHSVETEPTETSTVTRTTFAGQIVRVQIRGVLGEWVFCPRCQVDDLSVIPITGVSPSVTPETFHVSTTQLPYFYFEDNV